jgi:tetratricopeptide (TPR) repeat protein
MNHPLGFRTGLTRRGRLVVWLLGGLTLACLLAGLAARAARPTDALPAAEQALRQNDPITARAHLDRYLAYWPNDGPALLLAARAARRSDACADAEQLLVVFEQQFGPTDACRLEWTLLGVQQGDFADDEPRLRSTADGNHPATAEILEALAKGYQVTYRLRDALPVLDRLLDLSPGHVPAYLVRGTVRDRLRRWDEAEADFRRAVELAPANVSAHAALAGLLNYRGHTREAIYHYELVLRSRPGDPASLLGLARAFTDAADLDEAQRRLDELLAAGPDHAEALVERGRLALRRGRADEAETFLARAVRVAPWHRDGHQLYLTVLKDLGRGEAVSPWEARLAGLHAEDALGGRLKLQVKRTPGDPGVCWELWQWSVRNGQPEVGFGWLTEVLRRAPWHAPAHAALADYFERAGQPRRAALHRAAAGGR